MNDSHKLMLRRWAFEQYEKTPILHPGDAVGVDGLRKGPRVPEGIDRGIACAWLGDKRWRDTQSRA